LLKWHTVVAGSTVCSFQTTSLLPIIIISSVARGEGASGSTRSGAHFLRAHQHTFSSHLKRVFKAEI